jgi:hypothetical protein
MSLRAERPRAALKIPRAALKIERIRNAMARATDQELSEIANEIGIQAGRIKQITAALDAEIERRHWPGQMTAMAA